MNNKLFKIMFLILILLLLISVFVGCDKKVIEKDPILWLQRSANDEGQCFDVDIKGKRLYISDGDKLVYFNISLPDSPKNKEELKRPQGVVASYIYDKYLFEITGGGSIRISEYNKASKVISLFDQFRASTEMQFYNQYAFVGSGKNIAVIDLRETIEIFKYNSFLSDVLDIGIIGNILAVSLEDGSFKIFDLTDLREPLFISGRGSQENIIYPKIASNDKYLFVVEEHIRKNEYVVKQVDVKNMERWREVLLSYEKINTMNVIDDYLGIIREKTFLDIYKITKESKLVPVLETKGYEISDFDIYQSKYVYVTERKADEYLKLYEIE